MASGNPFGTSDMDLSSVYAAYNPQAASATQAGQALSDEAALLHAKVAQLGVSPQSLSTFTDSQLRTLSNQLYQKEQEWKSQGAYWSKTNNTWTLNLPSQAQGNPQTGGPQGNGPGGGQPVPNQGGQVGNVNPPGQPNPVGQQGVPGQPATGNPGLPGQPTAAGGTPPAWGNTPAMRTPMQGPGTSSPLDIAQRLVAELQNLQEYDTQMEQAQLHAAISQQFGAQVSSLAQAAGMDWQSAHNFAMSLDPYVQKALQDALSAAGVPSALGQWATGNVVNPAGQYSVWSSDANGTGKQGQVDPASYTPPWLAGATGGEAGIGTGGTTGGGAAGQPATASGSTAGITSPGVLDQADIDALKRYIANLTASGNDPAKLAMYQQRLADYTQRLATPAPAPTPTVPPVQMPPVGSVPPGTPIQDSTGMQTPPPPPTGSAGGIGASLQQGLIGQYQQPTPAPMTYSNPTMPLAPVQQPAPAPVDYSQSIATLNKYISNLTASGNDPAKLALYTDRLADYTQRQTAYTAAAPTIAQPQPASTTTSAGPVDQYGRTVEQQMAATAALRASMGIK